MAGLYSIGGTTSMHTTVFWGSRLKMSIDMFHCRFISLVLYPVGFTPTRVLLFTLWTVSFSQAFYCGVTKTGWLHHIIKWRHQCTFWWRHGLSFTVFYCLFCRCDVRARMRWNDVIVEDCGDIISEHLFWWRQGEGVLHHAGSDFPCTNCSEVTNDHAFWWHHTPY